MKQQLRAISFAAAALLASAGALADSYPTRPITLVVGFPAGGGADTVARIVSDKMAKLLGQPVIIDNKPGAGTTIASDQVARAAPDGYTLLLGSANLYGSDKLLYKAVKYDGAKSFVPISRWSSAPMLLAVNKDVSAKTVQALIAEARQNPGKLAYSSSGTGVVTHLAGLSFEKAAGVTMLHVPYKGGAPSIQAVAAGDVQLTFGTPPSVLPMAQGQKLRVLAVTSGQRSPLFPDVPSIAEAGVKGYDYTFWFGLFAPAGLPPEMAQKLFDASVAALNDPDVKARMEKSGNESAPSKSLAEFRSWATAEGAKSKELTERSGATVE
ncbi:MULTISPECIES: tripartite tricarboxylate transporter substrate binding protein [Variovorax]|jgi:tripartite-type tricarboxylate transporter receptor subunit TctC|uniref:Bug family tripartite tricarboxylate transporter substrate binding protein n=1 Tax=Variovorax TaxID=34072 RepID=UPI000896B7F0|nr:MULTISPECIES: tripartite tricarboxylate transporter substrate binding protein [unclassified Variovorax]SDY96729.1 Tripartite-type tricarboxylate transporter, receptor component TctC [Variovorax sp. YR634]SET67846.1 Tripartite-type tricarboxylate transporter, receptor component TctC [Variovorax sp. OV084]SOD25021.1 Tripartite-type tricarboxylate transporter, receptor component TctC [Variovorax sp. YR752]